jgi:hypothetical protein
MKPKRLKVYARSGLISTKLPIVKDLIEIITHRPMYQNNMKMVLDTYTAIQDRFFRVDVIATVYPEVYPSGMPPILARLEPSHVYIRPH